LVDLVNSLRLGTLLLMVILLANEQRVGVAAAVGGISSAKSLPHSPEIRMSFTIARCSGLSRDSGSSRMLPG